MQQAIFVRLLVLQHFMCGVQLVVSGEDNA